MKTKKFGTWILLFVGVLMGSLGLVPAGETAESEYPNRPIQVIVPWGPGSASDLNSRIIAPHLEKTLKQPVVIINKPGGGGILGHTLIAKAKPDGYTLGLVSTVFGIYFLTHKDLEFNWESFTPIYAYAKVPMFFSVKNDAPWKTLKDFIADAKKSPGKLRYSTFGAFTLPHFATSDLCKKAGIELTLIPHAGVGDVLTALIGGHVEMAVTHGSAGHLTAGTIRALAVADRERLEDYPDIPTLTELGFPIVCYPILGHVAPKGTSPKVLEKLVQGYKEAMGKKGTAIADPLRKLEQYVVMMGPDEYARRMKEDTEYLTQIFKGIKLQ
jgi:tripartite-type tricarboxylate transporter receptor subunit TctC